ncbi:hypothetical protein LCGC14_2570270 [marine sediment metagenome]|uniref:Uncharacterized protein n=1 Tax=marine sediment metagenome TaxID=412755 RepID=A0A0F9CTJ4_9ZZZZ
MKVALKDGKIFDVRWKRVKDREYFGKDEGYFGDKLIDTHCYISEIQPGFEGKEKYDHLSLGRALLGNKDINVFNKAKGRKISLARALKDRFSRDDRILFWNEYKRSCKN